MKSRILPIFKNWLTTATPEQIEFVDNVYALCESNYACGGDVVVECFEPSEVLQQFESLDDVRDYCGLRLEKALNSRLGSDNDPELIAYERFKSSWQN